MNTNYLIPIILIYTTTLAPNHAFDMTEEGRRVILQTDIETVLVHTRIDNVEHTLNHLLGEAQIIRKQASNTKHVRNSIEQGKGGIQKLLIGSIDAVIQQIISVRNDFYQFFQNNAETNSKDKRAIEILGSFLSTMTGVPSTRDHRRVLEQIRSLRLDSSEIRQLMKKQNVENRDILQTFHYQENRLDNMTDTVRNLYRYQHESADEFDKLLAVMSMSLKVNAALESARIQISHLKAIMESDKHSLLSKFVITNQQLSKIIDAIYLKRKNDLPIFAGPECHNYFSQPIAHSWVSRASMTISTLLQIPMANMHIISTLHVLNQQNQIHSDLPLAIMNKDMNQYRYISLADFAKCTRADNSLVCQKREIKISPRLGCSLKRQNCNAWTTEVIHDITNSEIMISLQKSVNATLECDNRQKEKIELPAKAMLTIDIHCSLEAETFFIGKLSYRQLKEIEYNQNKVRIEFNLEHKALSDEKLANISKHSFIKGNRADIDSLIDRNKELEIDMYASQIASNQRWEKTQHESMPWETILSWTLIACLCFGLFSAMSWILRIQINLWKIRRTEAEVWTAEKEKDIIKSIKSQVSDMLIDRHIEMRKEIERNEEEIVAKQTAEPNIVSTP